MLLTTTMMMMMKVLWKPGMGKQMLETTIEEGGLPPFTAIYLKIRSMLSRSAMQLVVESVQ